MFIAVGKLFIIGNNTNLVGGLVPGPAGVNALVSLSVYMFLVIETTI